MGVYCTFVHIVRPKLFFELLINRLTIQPNRMSIQKVYSQATSISVIEAIESMYQHCSTPLAQIHSLFLSLSVSYFSLTSLVCRWNRKSSGHITYHIVHTVRTHITAKKKKLCCVFIICYYLYSRCAFCEIVRLSFSNASSRSKLVGVRMTGN